MRGNVAQFFELLDGFLFPAAAPEDIDVVGQGLHLALGAGGLAGEFFRLLFVADLQVELRLALARHLAGFGDLFFELVGVFVRCGLVGEQLSLVLANRFNAAVERLHRAHHGFVGVVVVFIYRAGRLFGLGPGLEFHFLQALLEFVELGQGLGTFFRLAKRVMGHADGGQALGLFLRNCGRLKVNRLR